MILTAASMRRSTRDKRRPATSRTFLSPQPMPGSGPGPSTSMFRLVTWRYMNRLTWSGIALHAGQLPGYPASHGCVRLPKDFAELLFGITKLGMTVVIADEKSQPEEVTHPGMVLGEYAAREFNAVDTAIKATEYSEGHDPAPKSPSVVVSSADKSIRVFDNGALAASGKVEIQNPEKTLGERVFTLNGADDQSGLLSWQPAAAG